MLQSGYTRASSPTDPSEDEEEPLDRATPPPSSSPVPEDDVSQPVTPLKSSSQCTPQTPLQFRAIRRPDRDADSQGVHPEDGRGSRKRTASVRSDGDSDGEEEEQSNRRRTDVSQDDIDEENIQEILEAEEENTDDAYRIDREEAEHMPQLHYSGPARMNRVVRDLEGPSTRMMVIVDTNGIHEIPVVSCSCDDALPWDLQLFHLGLYPATSRRPKTAFTFRLLDDVLMTTKECKTSIQNYYNKLRRITNELFPHAVPVSSRPHSYGHRTPLNPRM